jgi:hypothetical protein
VRPELLAGLFNKSMRFINGKPGERQPSMWPWLSHLTAPELSTMPAQTLGVCVFSTIAAWRRTGYSCHEF